MKKRILLTGAFGNIGSFVIDELLLQGFHVIAFDKKTPVTAKNSKRFQHPEVDIYWGDITDKQSVKSADRIIPDSITNSSRCARIFYKLCYLAIAACLTCRNPEQL